MMKVLIAAPVRIEIVLAVLVVVAIFLAIAVIQKRQWEWMTKMRLELEWGQVPTQEYSEKKREALRWYYETHAQGKPQIDDITWNDLDMDAIFYLLNHTESSIGEEYLYALLRMPETDSEKLAERNTLIHFFREHPEERMEMQLALSGLGKLQDVSIYEYLNRTEEITDTSNLKHILCALAVPVSLGASIMVPLEGIPLLVVVVFYNIFSYFKKKGEIGNYIQVLGYLLKILDFAKDSQKITAEALNKYTETIGQVNKKLAAFKRGAFFLVSGSGLGGNVADVVMDYVRMLTHVDLIKFNSMIRQIRMKKESFDTMFAQIGLLDSTIAVASFRQCMEESGICEPELSVWSGGSYVFHMENMYHPLVQDPVKNSIHATDGVLITGSNASGKSTFLKTVAINAILAQTVYTVLADSYQGNYFAVYSSMALRDNIMGQESYYIVEIKSLKRIMDAMNPELPILCFVDEVLRGTNTLERIASSSMILKWMVQQNAVCFAATHDIELTHILEKMYTNYHFTESIVEGDVRFDYLLHKGRAVSRNAIKLLEVIGYSKEVTRQAKAMADGFLENGVWRKALEKEGNTLERE